MNVSKFFEAIKADKTTNFAEYMSKVFPMIIDMVNSHAKNKDDPNHKTVQDDNPLAQLMANLFPANSPGNPVENMLASNTLDIANIVQLISTIRVQAESEKSQAPSSPSGPSKSFRSFGFLSTSN